MILPILAYGSPILKRKSKEISLNHPNLDVLINNMFETMYSAHGVGLAAPQIGQDIRLFIIDTSPFCEQEEGFVSVKKIFINANILQESGKEELFNEGCLSIPDIREDISRKPNVVIEYLDQNFNLCKESYTGINARVIKHEYDHVEGVLFIDRISSLRKRMIKSKLINISKGKIDVDYRMSFPVK